MMAAAAAATRRLVRLRRRPPARSRSNPLSSQEHVWGTDGLAKLEAIKAKVDPQGLFQCQKCVGFKGPVRDQ